MDKFNERFRQLRIEKGLTQTQLKDEFNKNYFRNFTAAAISQYENDKRIPEIDALRDFASFFGVSTSYLLGETNIRNSDTPKNFIYLIEKLESLSKDNIKRVDDYIELLKISEMADKYGGEKKI